MDLSVPIKLPKFKLKQLHCMADEKQSVPYQAIEAHDIDDDSDSNDTHNVKQYKTTNLNKDEMNGKPQPMPEEQKAMEIVSNGIYTICY